VYGVLIKADVFGGPHRCITGWGLTQDCAYPEPGLSRGVVKVQILGFLGLKKPKNFTDLKVSKFFSSFIV